MHLLSKKGKFLTTESPPPESATGHRNKSNVYISNNPISILRETLLLELWYIQICWIWNKVQINHLSYCPLSDHLRCNHVNFYQNLIFMDKLVKMTNYLALPIYKVRELNTFCCDHWPLDFHIYYTVCIEFMVIHLLKSYMFS